VSPPLLKMPRWCSKKKAWIYEEVMCVPDNLLGHGLMGNAKLIFLRQSHEKEFEIPQPEDANLGNGIDEQIILMILPD